jgi:hypothetical protein
VIVKSVKNKKGCTFKEDYLILCCLFKLGNSARTQNGGKLQGVCATLHHNGHRGCRGMPLDVILLCIYYRPAVWLHCTNPLLSEDISTVLASFSRHTMTMMSGNISMWRLHGTISTPVILRGGPSRPKKCHFFGQIDVLVVSNQEMKFQLVSLTGTTIPVFLFSLPPCHSSVFVLLAIIFILHNLAFFSKQECHLKLTSFYFICSWLFSLQHEP